MDSFFKQVDTFEQFVKNKNFNTEESMLFYIEKIRSNTVTEQNVKDVEQMGNELCMLSKTNKRLRSLSDEGRFTFILLTALQASLNPTKETILAFKQDCFIFGVCD